MVGGALPHYENWAAQGKIDRKDGKYGLLSCFKYKLGQLEGELDKIKNNPDAELKRQKVEWQNMIAGCKAKFLSLFTKLALELSGLSEPELIEEKLSKAIDEALIELINE